MGGPNDGEREYGDCKTSVEEYVGEVEHPSAERYEVGVPPGQTEESTELPSAPLTAIPNATTTGLYGTIATISAAMSGAATR